MAPLLLSLFQHVSAVCLLACAVAHAADRQNVTNGGGSLSYARGAARPQYSSRPYHDSHRHPPNLPDEVAMGTLPAYRHGGVVLGHYPGMHTSSSRGSIAVYEPSESGEPMGPLGRPYPNAPCVACPPGMFLCISKCECIPDSLRCDAAKDCSMGEDETDCDMECNNAPGRVRCPHTHRCIAAQWVCDGVDDCGDASDETHCGLAGNCTEGKEFSCSNGFCVPVAWRCDGENDCRDNSDENNCTNLAPCSETHFACGDLTCIPEEDRCNHHMDCSDNSDEIGCDADVVVCEPSEFSCKYPLCVLEEYRCDGDNDCGDWSDEENCPRRSGPACVHGDFQCRSGDCVSGRQRCNGESDCEEGEDELDCGPRLEITCSPTQYACASGFCIEKSWVCDGTDDCPSGEDEQQCETSSCDARTHFTCSTETNTTSTASPARPTALQPFGLVPEPIVPLACIPKRHVCDGRKDCLAGDDERDCPTVHNCSGSSQCKQLCITTIDRQELCSCRPGFRLTADNRSCEDVDECSDDIDPPCQQICNNTEGSFLCGCRLGYVMRPDGRSCKSVDVPATLLLTNRVDIRQVNLNNLRSRTLVKGLHNAVALDFHWLNGELYWSDYSMHVIKKATLNGSMEDDVIRWGLQTPAGLAVDWVHNLLFWTDSELRRVDVANLDGSMPTTIAHTDLEKPRDVAVHPGEAFVFWTDWGPKPKIERVEMSGLNRIAVITTGVVWPNGLALDFDTNHIYWADASNHVIECSALDGSNRTKVLSKGLPHPFALTLFEDQVYWTDWHTRSVLGAHKETGKRVHLVLDRLHFPMQIHSCHPKRQPAYRDRCPRGKDACSHLCLPSAQSFTCVCPVGVNLMSNRRTCESHPDSLLIYARKKELRLREMSSSGSPLGIGSSARDVVLPVDGVRHAHTIAWDAAEDFIFWSDFKAMTINRARRDGSNQRAIIDADLQDPIGLAVDWVRRRLYFSDFKSRRIETTDLAGRQRIVLLWDLPGPRHVALYPPSGLMFWSNWGPSPSIEIAGMDGKGRRSFITEDLTSPGALAIDMDSKRLLWTDAGQRIIASVSLDGQDRKTIKGGLAHPLGLAVFADRIYWTDIKTNDLNMMVKGSNYTVRSGVPGLLEVAVFNQRLLRSSVSTQCDNNNFQCSHACLLANNPDNAACACPVGYRMKDDHKSCEPYPGPYVLLARTLDLRRVPLNMPYLMDVLLPVPHLRNAMAVDADRKTGDVYFSDTMVSAILKTSMDGENTTMVIANGVDTPYGIAVDSVGRMLYWTDSGRRIIEVSKLDGSMRKVLVYGDLRNPCALTLHYPRGNMFWADWDEPTGRIESAAMDGSRRSLIVSENLGWPGGLAVYNDRLYWSDVRLKRIESVRLDGSQRSVVVDHLHEQPAGLSVMNGALYWGYRGATGSLHRLTVPKKVPVNVSEDTVIRPGLPWLIDIKAIDTQPLPPDVCATARCSHLCLRNMASYSCACPTGVALSSDGRNCVTNPAPMLLFATGYGLARISSTTMTHYHDVLLPVPNATLTVAIDFHWDKKLVVFADTQGIIRVVSMLNWTNPRVIVDQDLSEPYGLAVDWLADNLFWTDAKRRMLEVARLDGSCRKTLISSGLYSPRAIVVFPKRGAMFWVDWASQPGEMTRIERAHLDGSGRRAIVTEDLDKPNGLTLDSLNSRLFWVNLGRGRIESCELNGNRRLQLVPEASSVFGLTTLGDHIFWADFSKQTVERADKRTGRDRKSIYTTMVHVVDMKALADTRQRRNGIYPCGKNNGGCSHLCLTRDHSLACVCPNKPDGRPCVPSVNERTGHSLEDEEYPEEVEGPSVPNPSVITSNATNNKVSPVSGVFLFSIPVAVIVVVLGVFLVCAHLFRSYNMPAAAKDKLRHHSRSGVLTYSNPNYLSESGGSCSGGGGSGSLSGGGGGGSGGGGGGYRGWMRRLKYDRSAERVFDVHDDGRRGGASPEILSLINSPGSIIAEHSSSVMEGISPPPTPPPPPRCSRHQARPSSSHLPA